MNDKIIHFQSIKGGISNCQRKAAEQNQTGIDQSNRTGGKIALIAEWIIRHCARVCAESLVRCDSIPIACLGQGCASVAVLRSGSILLGEYPVRCSLENLVLNNEI